MIVRTFKIINGERILSNTDIVLNESDIIPGSLERYGKIYDIPKECFTDIGLSKFTGDYDGITFVTNQKYIIG